jgi:hypothetical protein
MLYRAKFDGFVGRLLSSAFESNKEKLEFWPPGATAEFVRLGKETKRSPHEAALVAVTDVAVQRCNSGDISRNVARQLIDACLAECRRNGYEDLEKEVIPAVEKNIRT